MIKGQNLGWMRQEFRLATAFYVYSSLVTTLPAVLAGRFLVETLFTKKTARPASERLVPPSSRVANVDKIDKGAKPADLPVAAHARGIGSDHNANLISHS